LPPFIIPPEELWPAIFRMIEENDHRWRFTKKGDKRSPADIAKSVEAKRRAREARQLAAAERTLADTRVRRLSRAPSGGSIADRMLRAMEPGNWYGMGDIARMAGVGSSARAKVHQVLLRRGWAEKAENPAFRGILSPPDILAGAEPEPLHLFRLTELGLRVKGVLLSEIS
jgi:hypothetical protein